MNFKEPQFDEEGKFVKKVTSQKEDKNDSNLEALRVFIVLYLFLLSKIKIETSPRTQGRGS